MMKQVPIHTITQNSVIPAEQFIGRSVWERAVLSQSSTHSGIPSAPATHPSFELQTSFKRNLPPVSVKLDVRFPQKEPISSAHIIAHHAELRKLERAALLPNGKAARSAGGEYGSIATSVGASSSSVVSPSNILTNDMSAQTGPEMPPGFGVAARAVAAKESGGRTGIFVNLAASGLVRLAATAKRIVGRRP